MKSKKHLSFSSLRKEFTRQINKFPDKRQEGKREYSNQDAIMSGFACMYFSQRDHYVTRSFFIAISDKVTRSQKYE